jgi:dipeptidyl aminopeptidase/acylaminoacyl peptidase
VSELLHNPCVSSLVKRALRFTTLLAALYLFASALAGIFLAEAALHYTRIKMRNDVRAMIYERVQLHHARLTDVQITALDGATLRGWYVTPEKPNGEAVALFHGISDTRAGVAGFGELFLTHGYSVLLPDSRAHGESGGAIATYGVLEAKDISLWAQWLKQRNGGCVYGFGESMGAGLVLQSLREHAPFCAVIAESAFSDFRHAAYDRLADRSGIPHPLATALAALPVEIGIAYARFRYDVHFEIASPAQAVAQSQVPVLLIHGLADRNLLPQNSERIYAGRARNTDLWLVPKAAHCGAWSVEGARFDSRVLDFLSRRFTLAAGGGQAPSHMQLTTGKAPAFRRVKTLP